jgi:hypothetical protein
MSSHYAELKKMKRAIILKPPKSTSAKAVDRDNPPWSEETLGESIMHRGHDTPSGHREREIISARLAARDERQQYEEN